MPDAPLIQPRNGKVITFYSYKGGTGRSMALANVAWILASAGKRVIAMDWDLEAPGLHRYFRPFLLDKDLVNSSGVIDFVGDYCVDTAQYLEESAVEPEHGSPEPAIRLPQDWCERHCDLIPYKMSLDWRFPRGGVLDFVPAGRQSSTYPSRVNLFDWKVFYDTYAGGRLIDTLRLRMCADYDYVLIDSRTGVSDTSGICTIQLPDVLAVCFTLNNQSIQGAYGILDSIVRKRLSAPTPKPLPTPNPPRAPGSAQDNPPLPPPRPLRICPIKMRVPTGELQDVGNRRAYARWKFDRFLFHVPERDRENYWAAVELLNYDAYALQEVLAPFADRPGSLASVLSTCERITAQLTADDVTRFEAAPSEEVRKRVLAQFAETDFSAGQKHDRDPEQLAEEAFLALTPEQQAEARRILTKLVYLVPNGNDSLQQRSRQELDNPETVAALAAAGVITIDASDHVDLASERILRKWARLTDWLKEDRQILTAAQRFRSIALEWEAEKRPSGLLLSGSNLTSAADVYITRPDLLSPVENEFIAASRHRSKRRMKTQSAVVGLVFVILLFAIAGLIFWRKESNISRILAAAQASPDPLTAVLLGQGLTGYAAPPGGLKTVAQIAQNRVPRVVLRGHEGAVLSAVFSPDGKSIATAGEDRTVRVWTAATGAQVYAHLFVDTMPTSVAFALPKDPSGAVLLAATNNGQVLATGPSYDLWASHRVARGNALTALTCCAPDSSFAVSAKDKLYIIHPAETSNIPTAPEIVEIASSIGSIAALRYMPGSDRLLAAGNQGAGLVQSKIFFGGFLTLDPVNAIDVWRDHEGNNYEALGLQLGTVRVFKGNEKVSEKDLPDASTAVAFSPDGKSIAVGSNNNVYLWPSYAVAGAPQLLRGHAARITDVRFSPDGSTILSASRDGTVRLWPANSLAANTSSWDSVIAAFGRLTNACLIPSQRESLLKEDAATAMDRYSACEKANGRTPLSASTLASIAKAVTF